MLSGFVHSAIGLKNFDCHPWGGWTSWIWPASGPWCGRVDGLGFRNSWNRLGSIPDICRCSFSGLCSLLSDLYGRQALKDARKKLVRWKKVPGDCWETSRFVPFLEVFWDFPRSLSTRTPGGAVGSGGGFEDVIHRMIAFQRLYGATKLATFNTTDRQRLLWKKKMPRSSEKGLTSSKVAQFEAE